MLLLGGMKGRGKEAAPLVLRISGISASGRAIRGEAWRGADAIYD